MAEPDKKLKKSTSRKIQHLAEALALAIVAAGPLSVFVFPPGGEPDTPAASAGRDALIAAHSIQFNTAACPQGEVHVAHVEDRAGFLFREDASGTPSYTQHAAAARRILSDRFNAGQQGCVKVHLLDLDANRETQAARIAYSTFDVTTVSSALFYAEPAPPPQAPVTAQPPRPAPEPAPPSPIMQRRSALGENVRLTPEFWDRQSDTIIVASAGNDGRDPERAKRKYYVAFDDADTIIRTGALTDDGRIAAYSSRVAPDLVWYTAFSQDFCYPRTAAPNQIRAYASYLGREVANDRLPAKAAAPDCDQIGTSFVAPDHGGFIARAVRDYPMLDSHEITLAAYLATAQVAGRDFTRNARGKWFNDVDAGHGAFVPSAFTGFLNQLAAYKSVSGESHEMNRHTVTGRVTSGREAGFTFSHNLTSLRTIGHLTFKQLPAEGRDSRIDHFPDTVEVISPAGTIYNIPLSYNAHQPGDRALVSAAFSVSAFLGEQTGGEWRIRAPEGYLLEGANMSQIGVKPEDGNTMDWLIDYALGWHRDHPNLRTATAPAPWNARQQVAGAPAPSPIS